MLRITVPRIVGLLALALLASYAFVLAPKYNARHAPEPYAFSGKAPTAMPDWLVAALSAPAPTAAATGAAAPGDTPGATPVPTPSPTGGEDTGSPAPAPAEPAPAAAPFPAPGGAFMGLMTKAGPYDLAPVEEFATAVKHNPNVLEFSVGWWDKRFDRRIFDTVAERGIMPMVAWEPWDFHKESKVDKLRGEQPDYALSRIIGGEFDGYIKQWAEGVKNLGYPIALRFAHEMNGYWYPWAEQANGNRRGQYVQAWKHVHDLFRQAGADKVVWVWSPNIDYENATPLDSLYPGDDYVDWIGLSGYYGTVGLEKYASFEQIFEPTLKKLRTFSQKPVVITETAATDSSGQKARWIAEMFEQLPRHPDIIGLIWYEAVKEVDWRITASGPAAAAYAAGVSAPRYAGQWTVRSQPLLTVPPPAPPAATPAPSAPASAPAPTSPSAKPAGGTATKPPGTAAPSRKPTTGKPRSSPSAEAG
ncbi:glycoside hydrolase family 26 protein [Kitasatospora purpeofusca]|uniref:glycoside hydrolase family 26 protein n=1 Tax=Kitasatospora purpeofusca TaxID=67352 RepID=UPI00368A4E26